MRANAHRPATLSGSIDLPAESPFFHGVRPAGPVAIGRHPAGPLTAFTFKWFDDSGVQLCSVAAMPFEAARSRRPKNALQAYGPATAMQIARKINVGHEIDGRRRVFPRCRAGSPALNTTELRCEM